MTHASSLIFYQIVIKVAGNQDRHKSSDEFDFGPLVSMANLYVFEMRFDFGTLDSGERSLPFGLLVICLTVCFSHSTVWLLKQVIFDNSLVEKKSHKDINVIQNDNSGGLKHTIPEIDQRSNECKL